MRASATGMLARRIKQRLTWRHRGTQPRSGSVMRAVLLAGMAIAMPAAVVLAVPASPTLAAAFNHEHMLTRSGLAGSAAAGTAWSVVPSPNTTAPTGQFLFGTCVNASSCMAVGTYVTASAVGVTLAEQWNGTQWAIQRPPNPAGARVSQLVGVACAQASSCTAVGYWVSASGEDAPMAEGWNGTRWQLEPTPKPAGAQQAFLYAVACPSSSACIAVGYYVTSSGALVNLAERWDGTQWAIQPTPAVAGTQLTYLDDVSCTNASACTAVGETGLGTLAERWNGTSWQVQPTPNPSQGGGGLLGVACTSQTSCIADGLSNAGTLAEAWNGTSWQLQPTPNPKGMQYAFLNGIGCSSASACTAVGGFGTSSGGFRPLAERWNGTTWATQFTPSPSGGQGDFLPAVACPSSSACVAFGYSHGSGTPLTMAQEWNGSSWRVQRTPNPTGAAENQFYGVSCTSPSACIGVGTGANGPLAERWDGTAWSMQALPEVPGAFLNGVSCTSHSSCIAVGGSASSNVAERWNGTKWVALNMPTPAGAQGSGMNSIACTSSSECIAAGGYSTTSSQNGPVLPLTERWNGTTWTILSTPAPAGAIQTYLNGISCSSPSACTITGEQHFASGVVETVAERWDGSTWTIQPTPNPDGSQFASLWGVDCTGPSACLATGSSDQGTLAERWDGTTWSMDTTPNPSSGGQLFGVACTSPSACTAIGFTFTNTGGMLLAEHWNGSSWSIEPTPLIPAAHDMGLPAIACPSTSSCSAVGGFANDGPGSVTLAEQWRGDDSAVTAGASVPTTPASRGACGLPVLALLGTRQGMPAAAPWLRNRSATWERSSVTAPPMSPVWCRRN